MICKSSVKHWTLERALWTHQKKITLSYFLPMTIGEHCICKKSLRHLTVPSSHLLGDQCSGKSDKYVTYQDAQNGTGRSPKGTLKTSHRYRIYHWSLVENNSKLFSSKVFTEPSPVSSLRSMITDHPPAPSQPCAW